MASSIPEFGELVREVMGDRSIRQAAREAELDHTTVMQMTHGRPTSAKTIARFASSLKASPAQRARLFLLAGYIDPENPESGAEVLFRGLRELERQRGAPLTVSFATAPETLTPDQARDMLTALAEAFGLQAP